MNIFLHALRCLRAVFRMCRERGAFGDPSAECTKSARGRAKGGRERGYAGRARRWRRRKREQDQERRWGGISRRIGKTAAARARSALFPRITLLKQRNSKSIPAEIYPCGEAVGFTRCKTGCRPSPAAGQAESQNEAKNGTHGHPVKQAPCGRGKPNTVRNGVRHARCVV